MRIILGALVSLLLAFSVDAQACVQNFDDVPSGTYITNEYESGQNGCEFKVTVKDRGPYYYWVHIIARAYLGESKSSPRAIDTGSELVRKYWTWFSNVEPPKLASPNKACGGAGRGKAGEPGQPGENCIALNNVLIIQENNRKIYKACRWGGTFKFEFPNPTTLDYITMFDVGMDTILSPFWFRFKEYVDFEIKVTDGRILQWRVDGLGNNAVQRVNFAIPNVEWVTVFVRRSSAVAEIGFTN